MRVPPASFGHPAGWNRILIRVALPVPCLLGSPWRAQCSNLRSDSADLCGGRTDGQIRSSSEDWIAWFAMTNWAGAAAGTANGSGPITGTANGSDSQRVRTHYRAESRRSGSTRACFLPAIQPNAAPTTASGGPGPSSTRSAAKWAGTPCSSWRIGARPPTTSPTSAPAPPAPTGPHPRVPRCGWARGPRSTLPGTSTGAAARCGTSWHTGSGSRPG